MRVIAELLEAEEAVTPYGGQAVSWLPLGSVWLRLEGWRRRERIEAGTAGAVEAATAKTRTDPRLVEGRVIRFGGADWTIARVDRDPDRPGRTNLTLERGR